MKSKLFLMLVVLLATFSESCTKENQKSTDDLIGYWQSEKIEFNGKSFSGDFEQWNNSTGLSLEAEAFYYKNYVTGNWKLQDDKITLTPNDGLGIAPQIYKVISVSETSLVLEIELTEGEYCCDFDEFESEEKLQIIEHFKRIE